MTQEDIRNFVSLARFVIKKADRQTTVAKLILARLQDLEDLRRLRDQLGQLPDSPEKARVAERLSAFERSVDLTAEIGLLRTFLAGVVSDHEKMEVYLAILRASLPPSFWQELR